LDENTQTLYTCLLILACCIVQFHWVRTYKTNTQTSKNIYNISWLKQTLFL